MLKKVLFFVGKIKKNFKHYYSGDFPEVLLNKIAQSIYDYHTKNATKQLVKAA
jgi:hypothetical protein